MEEDLDEFVPFVVEIVFQRPFTNRDAANVIDNAALCKYDKQRGTRVRACRYGPLNKIQNVITN